MKTHEDRVTSTIDTELLRRQKTLEKLTGINELIKDARKRNVCQIEFIGLVPPFRELIVKAQLDIKRRNNAINRIENYFQTIKATL